jgi:hypothetical protein
MNFKEIEERISELACEKFELLRKIEVVDRELDDLIERKSKSAPKLVGRNLISYESGNSGRITSL